MNRHECTSPGCLRAVVVMHSDRPFCLDHWRQVQR